jgi:hypothetical protein
MFRNAADNSGMTNIQGRRLVIAYAGFFADMPTPEACAPSLPPCAICGEPCDLETCEVNWNGKAVHEEMLSACNGRPESSQVLAI